MVHVAAPVPVSLLLMSLQGVSGGINKPLGEWLCDYCSMGRSSVTGASVLSLLGCVNVSGPPEVEDECGTPILCMFYGLLFFIICLTIYSTARGTKE